MKYFFLFNLVLFATAPAALAANVKITKTNDPFNDDRIGIVSIRTDKGRFSLHSPAIIYRCKAGVEEVYVDFDEYLSSRRNDLSLVYRVDQEVAVDLDKYELSHSTDGTAIFLNSGAKVALIEGLKRGGSIVVQARDYQGTSVGPYRFALTGTNRTISEAATYAGCVSRTSERAVKPNQPNKTPEKATATLPKNQTLEQRLSELFSKAWKKPGGVLIKDPVQVNLIIDRDGNIVNYAILNIRGNLILERSVLKAINSIGTIPFMKSADESVPDRTVTLFLGR